MPFPRTFCGRFPIICSIRNKFNTPNLITFTSSASGKKISGTEIDKWMVVQKQTRYSVPIGDGNSMNHRLKEGGVIKERDLISIRSTQIRIPDPAGLVHPSTFSFFSRLAGCPVCDLHLYSIARRHRDLVNQSQGIKPSSDGREPPSWSNWASVRRDFAARPNPVLSYVLQKYANKRNVALALIGTRPALRQDAMEAALIESDPVRPKGSTEQHFSCSSVYIDSAIVCSN
jgi:hypothetical protein